MFAEEFLLPSDGSHDILLDGSMDEVWSTWSARPLLAVLARADVMFPESGRDIPTTMHVYARRDRSGRPCHHWDRTFMFEHVTRRINARLVWEPDRRWVAEWMGPADKIKMAWHVKFHPPLAIAVTARSGAR